MSGFINIPESSAANYKGPVDSSGSLPSTGNADGDVRVALDTSTIYVWSETSMMWVASGGGGGSGLTDLNGQTGSTQNFATGSSGADFNISSAGNVHTFNIPDASSANRGVVTTGAQSFSGDKTFDNDVTITGTLTANGPVVGISQYKVEKFTLTAPDIAAKQVTLAATPTAISLTRLVPITGIEQDFSVDFTVTGAVLSWASLGLDGVLSSGDEIVVIYN